MITKKGTNYPTKLPWTDHKSLGRLLSEIRHIHGPTGWYFLMRGHQKVSVHA